MTSGSPLRFSRRELLRGTALVGGVAFITGCRSEPSARGSAGEPVNGTSLEPAPLARNFGFDTDITLTPTADFYTLTYHPVPPPRIDPDTYRLEVDGLVAEPQSMSLSDIKALESSTIMRTLACISNPAGGSLIGNAIWEGVRFSEVLERAQPDTAGAELKLESADGYHTGIARDLAMDSRSYLVHGMNGASLPSKHGFPLRCLFPGRYGQKQPKWLTRVTVQEARHKGHWEAQGWSDRAPVLINSRFERPPHRATVIPPVVVEGIAFSDLSGLARVEIIVNDARSYDAQLTRAPEPYSDLVWTEWSWTWADAVPGDHTLLAKAYDGNGRSQGRERRLLQEGTFPDGTSVMDSIRLRVPEPSD